MSSAVDKKELVESSEVSIEFHIRPAIQCIVSVLLGTSSLYLYSLNPVLTMLVCAFSLGLLASGTFIRPRTISD